MWTKWENFTLRFFICAVLLVTYVQCRRRVVKKWDFYAVDGVLTSFSQGNTYGVFNVTGKPHEMIIQYGKDSRNSDELQEMEIFGYANGKKDLGRQNEGAGARQLCSVVTPENNAENSLRDVAARLILYGVDSCNLPGDRKFLMNSGFVMPIRISPKLNISCTEPWDYQLVIKRYSTTVMEATFKMQTLPLFKCAEEST